MTQFCCCCFVAVAMLLHTHLKRFDLLSHSCHTLSRTSRVAFASCLSRRASSWGHCHCCEASEQGLQGLQTPHDQVSGALEHAFDLDNVQAAHTFDADVLYFALADDLTGRALPRRDALRMLRASLAAPELQLTAAFQEPARAWPGAPQASWDGFHRRKVEYIVFASAQVLTGRVDERQRTLFTSICRSAGLEWLACAHVRVCTRTGNCHITATVVNQLHLQLLERECADAVSIACAHTGWRIFRAAARAPAPAPACAPTALRTRNQYEALQPPAPFPHMVGTLNTTGLHSSSAPQKVVGIVELMRSHELGILAVQETRLATWLCTAATHA